MPTKDGKAKSNSITNHNSYVCACTYAISKSPFSLGDSLQMPQPNLFICNTVLDQATHFSCSLTHTQKHYAATHTQLTCSSWVVRVPSSCDHDETLPSRFPCHSLPSPPSCSAPCPPPPASGTSASPPH